MCLKQIMEHFSHLRSFLNYHPKGRFKDHSILVRKKGKLFSLFPAVEQMAGGGKILISHPGATVGSFALPENLSIADAFELAGKLIEYAKSKNFQLIKINLPPNLYQKRLSNHMEYSFFRLGLDILKERLQVSFSWKKTIEETKKKFRPSHLRAIRKAVGNNIIVKESQDIGSF